MRLLLDTHALLWFIVNNPKLSSQARAAIVDPRNERLLASTALVEGITLVSVDPAFDAYGVSRLW